MTALHLICVWGVWLSMGCVIHCYLIYPLLLEGLSRVWGTTTTAADLPDDQLPLLSLVISAHNEQAVIASRIKNALSVRYPKQKTEVVVISDGSTDATADIVRGYAGQGVRLIHNPLRRGKAESLCSAFGELQGEVLLLSDANSFIDADAARSLVKWFVDPSVGSVCGRLILTDPISGKNADSAYWKYETFLKLREARLGGLLGSNGAIYAIRKEVFVPVPAGTIVDDFVIPLMTRLKKGCRILYDAQAVAREETAPTVGSEFMRRCRIGAGGWQAIVMLWPLLNPLNGWIAFTFFSHKVLRWLCPFFLLAALLGSAALAREPLFAAFLALQVMFYGVAILAHLVPPGVPVGRLLRLATMFTLMNAALFVGFFRWAFGRQGGTWMRTQRSGESTLVPGATGGYP